MSIESFIRAMPKAELHVHLEGAASRGELLIIADQNEISESLKHFNTWVAMLDKPDYDRLDELIKVTSLWVRLPEDLTRLAYDVGTLLAKQNVRYAEVTINPSLYPELGQSLEGFLGAINDGRDRARRAWGIQMNWIVAVPRDEPRKADDYARFVQTAAARRNGVVGIGLVGKETAQPVGQFERAFQAAEKKDVPRVVHAGDVQGADGIQKVLDALLPNRVADAWGAADSQDLLNVLVERQIALDLSMARALRYKKIAKYDDYPLRKLYDEGVTVTLGSDMPSLLKTTLNEQYEIAATKHGFDVGEIEEIALNAVRVSFQEDDAKAQMTTDFEQAYATLRDEHITAQTT